MDSTRFKTIEELFHDAVAHSPGERAGFLDEACGADLDLRGEVESLLLQNGRATELIDLKGPGEAPTIVDRGTPAEGPGTMIGAYKILQQIGEGGFGVVYMAEQLEPVQRKVALKIIKLGMDTRQVIARFEAERQALALMDHPNIAKVLEAGATETGRPYFVMELVKGIPIDDYCDRNKLGPRDRLELFLQVCSAVQHAHQKGVIHRDLKPANVLVTLHDARPVPKVIDFGIAKATSRQLTEKTLFTEFRQLIGTPQYMSPDQAEISGLDVDTRTDIYSLGVILYELLTGTTPFTAETLNTAGYAEIQRIIREVEPPKPSTRMNTLTDEGTGEAIAALRGTEPALLSRLIRGDLDWIVMRAMEKDRTRRYQSASELAGDVRRHLEGHPILAGPPSVVYKFRKFVGRHRLGVAASVFIAAALVFGLAIATFGLLEARQEARRSQRIADFLQDLFVSTDAEAAVAGDVDTARVLATAREVFGDDHATVAATLTSRAVQVQSQGDLEAAEALFEESLRIWRETGGDDNPNVGTTLSRLGMMQIEMGDHQSAIETLREAARIVESNEADGGLARATTLAYLGTALSSQGEFAEAEVHLRESIRLRREVAPHQRLQIAMSTNLLANAINMSGRTQEMVPVMHELVADWRAAIPEESSFLGRVLVEAGIWFVENGHSESAEPMLREAIDIFEAVGDDAPLNYQAAALRVMFRILERRGAYREAIEVATRGLAIAPLIEGGRHEPEVIADLGHLAWLIARDSDRPQSEYALALDTIDRVMEARPDAEAYVNTKGVLQYRTGDDAGALATLARSNAVYAQRYPTGVPADLAFIAMAHHRLGNADEAAEAMRLLREAMTNPETARSTDNQKHLSEAESVVGRSP